MPRKCLSTNDAFKEVIKAKYLVGGTSSVEVLLDEFTSDETEDGVLVDTNTLELLRNIAHTGDCKTAEDMYKLVRDILDMDNPVGCQMAFSLSF